MKILLARPRGFCAGVERAIKCVERAIELYGAPVYVLNDIVHNAHVVNELREKGAVFVKRLEDVPKGSHLLFSAHGVSPSRWEDARERQLEVIDATCPLVAKVHNEARRFADKDYTIILIGEPGHDETIGTMGWAPEHIRRVFTIEEVEQVEVPNPEKVAYITQTTLSVDDCARVIQALTKRFPNIAGPRSGDICYATQNRPGPRGRRPGQRQFHAPGGDLQRPGHSRLSDFLRENDRGGVAGRRRLHLAHVRRVGARTAGSGCHRILQVARTM